MFLASDSFIQMHVAISLVAIVAGFVVILGLLTNRMFDRWTVLFLTTTALTSLTGFLFPFKGMTPGIVVGIVSLATLTVAIYARFVGRLDRRWRQVNVIFAVVSLYLNVFVLIVQSFQKIDLLQALAPHQTEPPFLVVQGIAFLAFAAAGWFGTKQFRDRPQG